ncbi:MAG: hypothetical protein IV092_23090 [Burkholderiaceae bacterium]|nr:hypothetical protein [Burkholderiaceae bacterium]
MVEHRIIHIQAEAPAKPELGAPCNGCGVCCLLEPCPVGMLVSRRRRGTCRALLWSDEQARYLCGMVIAPQQFLPWLAPLLQPLAVRWARRLISAGKGCDAELQIQQPPASAD